MYFIKHLDIYGMEYLTNLICFYDTFVFLLIDTNFLYLFNVFLKKIKKNIIGNRI